MSILVGNPIPLGINVATAIQLTNTIEADPVISGNTGTEDSVQIPGTIHINTGADMYYEYVQSVPSSEWTIYHNLGLKPNISVYDADGDEVLIAVEHLDNNTAHIIWPTPTSGTAYCS